METFDYLIVVTDHVLAGVTTIELFASKQSSFQIFARKYVSK